MSTQSGTVIDVSKEKKSASMQQLYLRLRAARERTGITQAEVTRQLKLKTRSSVCQWEDGTNEPRAARLRQLAALYNVSHEWLVNGDAAIVRDVIMTNFDALLDRAMRKECKELAVQVKRPALYRVITDMMAGWNLKKEDIVVVDLKREAEPRDVVIAEYRDMATLIRVYFPPYLYALPLHAQPAPLIVDGDHISIVGVVYGVSRPPA